MSRRRKQFTEETSRIRDMTVDGRGIAETIGKSAFVDGALTGEVVRFQRYRPHSNYDEALLLEVVEQAADRVSAPCDFFGQCGGCSLQHLGYTAQLALKQQALLQALQRIGNVTPATILEPLAGRPYAYRRRARLGARVVEKKGRLLLGFRERRNSCVTDMNSCATLEPELSRLIPLLTQLLNSLRIRSRIPQVEMSKGDNAISLVIRVLDDPGSADRNLLQRFAESEGLQVWLQPGGPASLEPLDPDRQPEELWYALPDFDLRLAFGPLDFIQVNQDMNQRMIAQSMELARPQSHERVLDLFCGIGNFSLALARLAGEVTGVELDSAMVRKAAANAARNKLSNVSFESADLASPNALQERTGKGYDLVLIDPPRAGAQEVLAQIAETGAKRILYVSCHPATLARDAGILCSTYDYRLSAAGAMDMFPQTSHVEAMALFQRA